MGILERKEYHRKSGYTHRKFLDKKNGTRLIKAESFLSESRNGEYWILL